MMRDGFRVIDLFCGILARLACEVQRMTANAQSKFIMTKE